MCANHVGSRPDRPDNSVVNPVSYVVTTASYIVDWVSYSVTGLLHDWLSCDAGTFRTTIYFSS